MLEPMAVSASGRGQPRPVFGVPGRFIVHDVARDGTWLGVREDLALGVRARVPGQDNERELSWLGSSGARGLSRDGRWLLMVDVGRRGGRDYSVVVRQTDASQTIRLGAGFPQGFSPTVRSPRPSPRNRRSSCSTRLSGRAGQARSRSAESHHVRVVVSGRQAAVRLRAEPSHAPRCYAQGLSGPPTPVTAKGVVGSLGPDGRTMLLTQPKVRSRFPASATRPPGRSTASRAATGRSHGARTAAPFTSSAACSHPPRSSASTSKPVSGQRSGVWPPKASAPSRRSTCRIGRKRDRGTRTTTRVCPPRCSSFEVR